MSERRVGASCDASHRGMIRGRQFESGLVLHQNASAFGQLGRRRFVVSGCVGPVTVRWAAEREGRSNVEGESSFLPALRARRYDGRSSRIRSAATAVTRSWSGKVASPAWITNA